MVDRPFGLHNEAHGPWNHDRIAGLGRSSLYRSIAEVVLAEGVGDEGNDDGSSVSEGHR